MPLPLSPRLTCMAALSVALLAPLPVLGTSAAAQPTAELHREHPLVGVVWSAREGRRIEGAALHDRLAQADLVLLGETHDNPNHHRLQAETLQALVDRGRRPSVVFEMIPADLEPRLDAHLRDSPRDAEGLGAALDWEGRGWPAWSLYRPIAGVALGHGLGIEPGDLAGDTRRTLGRQGADAVGPDERRRLGLEAELPAQARLSLDDTLFGSHCGMVPREALAPMRLMQRARDGAMADALLRAGQAVLIAGAGHARHDWGVPASLRARVPGARIASVAFMEVEPGAEDPAAYLPEGTEGRPVFDYVVFTPATKREDPCAALRGRMAK